MKRPQTQFASIFYSGAWRFLFRRIYHQRALISQIFTVFLPQSGNKRIVRRQDIFAWTHSGIHLIWSIFTPYSRTILKSFDSGKVQHFQVLICRRIPSEVDATDQRSNSVRRGKIVFGINFMPLWRIIAVEFKHYDIKISVSAACHSGMRLERHSCLFCAN